MGMVTGTGTYTLARNFLFSVLGDLGWHDSDELAHGLVNKIDPEKLIRLAVRHTERARAHQHVQKPKKSYILDEPKDFRVLLAGSRLLVHGIFANALSSRLLTKKIEKMTTKEGKIRYRIVSV